MNDVEALPQMKWAYAQENDKSQQKLVLFSFIRLIASDIASPSFVVEYNITKNAKYVRAQSHTQNCRNSFFFSTKRRFSPNNKEKNVALPRKALIKKQTEPHGSVCFLLSA